MPPADRADGKPLPHEGARAATREDLARLGELYDEARVALSTSRGGSLLLAETLGAGTDELLSELLGDPDACVEAGWYEGALVGLGIARTVERCVAPSTAVVSMLYVEPMARGVGVGESILAALLDWSRARGCAGVDVAALPGDRGTKSLLEQSGFAARKIVMHRRFAT
ncbi:MAG: acetyltransferase family protein [Acidimicrobiaceae bacterium]|nr:acetyltransferase family protein [Acidimicrobiaceae bacterium]